MGYVYFFQFTYYVHKYIYASANNEARIPQGIRAYIIQRAFVRGFIAHID
jgi:hypothetical protein